MRYKIIDTEMKTCSSVLDIGCNLGILTSMIGESGRFAVGVEKNPKAVKNAYYYHNDNDLSNFSIMNKEVTAENIQSFPQFDYVILFSVYHQMYKYMGERKAERLLNKIVGVARKKVFFEAAGQKSKYGDENLSFTDFDEDSIVEYNSEMLKTAIDCEVEIKYLGSIPRRHTVEGERYLFEVNKV